MSRVFVEEAGGSGLAAFAVCHNGPHTEGGNDTCLAKFGAGSPGPDARQALLDACEALATTELAAPMLLAAVSMGRNEAYRHLVARGFRTMVQGIAMHRSNEPSYSRAGACVARRLALARAPRVGAPEISHVNRGAHHEGR